MPKSQNQEVSLTFPLSISITWLIWLSEKILLCFNQSLLICLLDLCSQYPMEDSSLIHKIWTLSIFNIFEVKITKEMEVEIKEWGCAINITRSKEFITVSKSANNSATIWLLKTLWGIICLKDVPIATYIMCTNMQFNSTNITKNQTFG